MGRFFAELGVVNDVCITAGGHSMTVLMLLERFYERTKVH